MKTESYTRIVIQHQAHFTDIASHDWIRQGMNTSESETKLVLRKKFRETYQRTFWISSQFYQTCDQASHSINKSEMASWHLFVSTKTLSWKEGFPAFSAFAAFLTT